MGPVCRAGGTASGLLMGVELSGNFSITPEIPIAAIAEWRSQSGGEAILSFPIINGGGFFRLGEQLRFGQGATFASISGQEQPLQSFAVDRPRETPGFLYRAGSPRFGFGMARFRNPIWLHEVLQEVSMPGVLDVRPARDLALASFFGKYPRKRVTARSAGRPHAREPMGGRPTLHHSTAQRNSVLPRFVTWSAAPPSPITEVA